ncbi:MAG: hypothetical protein WCD76_01055 [Pyrinomonadaceae bacterium]
MQHCLNKSEDAVKFAEDGRERDLLVSALSTKGDVLHHSGNLTESRNIFERAEEIKGQGRQPLTFPHSFGHRRRDLLLSQGEYDEVKDTARRILESSGAKHYDLIDSALLYLSLGQAYLFQSPPDYVEAKANLDQAMDYLLRAGRVVHIPRGRLALADLHLMTGELSEAKFNLDEALEMAKRNHTVLHQADCHLKYTRLYLELNENEKAYESWPEAKEIIDRCDYRLRDVDSQVLSTRLYLARGEKEKAHESVANAKETRDRMGYHRRDEDIKGVERQLRGL